MSNGAVDQARTNLSEHTVRDYLFRIFDKLGISSRVELVLYAFSGTEGNPASESSRAYSAPSWRIPRRANAPLASLPDCASARLFLA